MAGHRASTEEKLAALRSLSGPPSLKTVAAALRDRSNLIVAKAASLCASHRLAEAVPLLLSTYQGLLQGDPGKKDRGCLAKTALIRTLYELDYLDPAFYQANLAYVQMEPCWGGQEDTAVEIRCVSAAGFTASNRGRTVFPLLEALLDPEPAVRLAAVRALASLETEAAEAVLRLQALRGDSHAEITAECLSALLRFPAEDLPAFAARFLRHSSPALRELAALALGESKRPEAVAALMECWETSRPDRGLRQALLRALGISRSATAFALLYRLLEEAPRDTAAAALESLDIYRDDPAISREIAARLAARPGPPLR